MAIGDLAQQVGFPLVPNTGDGAQVRLGAQEINRTRDFVAQVQLLFFAIWPVSRGGTGGSTPAQARQGLGIFSGTAPPSDSVANNVNGSVYFKIL
jgi:hypothetical protein